LRILAVSSNSLQLGIDGAETNGVYDLYWTPEFAVSNAWVYLGRTDEGQTNIVRV
jgi:hypothetical protein